MSTFKVEVIRIHSVKHHPNADRLEIASIEGMAYQVVTALGHFHSGDKAFYFPIDSVIPEAFLDKFGIRPYYSKKLRAAKLRGIFSEGLLIPVDQGFTGGIGDDYTDFFGVTKYEYPIPQNMSGDVESPIGPYKFPSPENLKRFRDVFHEGEEVVVTEKIHGVNFTVWVDADGPHVGSHNYFWKNNDTNKNLIYTRAYNEHPGLHELQPDIQVFGEIYGVQDIKYGLDKGKLGLALFAVKRNGYFLNHSDFVAFCSEKSLPRVPVLYVGPYSWSAVSQFNNADSVLPPKHSAQECLMEGIIVQPLVERTHPEIGRVVLKLISSSLPTT